jgi:hypothetical protein
MKSKLFITESESCPSRIAEISKLVDRKHIFVEKCNKVKEVKLSRYTPCWRLAGDEI